MVDGFAIALPDGDDAVVRQAVIAARTRTLFVLASDDGACALLAYDLARGVELGREALGYIKFDNGGGALTVAPGGRRVAVGAEFAVSVYDVEGGRFEKVGEIAEDDQRTRPGVFVDDDRVVRSGEDGLVLLDLRSGATRVELAREVLGAAIDEDGAIWTIEEARIERVRETGAGAIGLHVRHAGRPRRY
jgi:hypothetical protein